MSYPLSTPVDFTAPGLVEITLSNTLSVGGIVWNIGTNISDEIVFGTNNVPSGNVLSILPDTIANPSGAIATPKIKLSETGNTVNLFPDASLAATYNFKFPALASTGDGQVLMTSGSTNVFYSVNPANTIVVRKDPGPNEFSSIVAAIASIPTIGPNIPALGNKYVVYIYEGEYFETAIVVPNYIYLVGIDMESVIIRPSGLGYSLIKLTMQTGLSFLAVSNTDPLFPAINCDNCGSFVILHKVTVISNCQRFLSCITDNTATDNSTLYLEYVDTTDALVYTLLCQDTNILGGFGSVVSIENFFSFGHNDNSIIVDGLNTSLLSHASEMSSDGTGNCIRVKNGSDIDIRGMAISNYTNGFLVDNDGQSPSIITAGITYVNNTMNINMLNTTATGQADGYTAYLKTAVPKIAPFFITNQNAQIITIAKKGGNFTSIVSALASITDNSPTYRYIIEVGPGEYIEPQIVLKPFVAVVGNFQTQCIISSDPSVAGLPFITGVGYSSLNKVTVTTSSYATPPSYLVEFQGDPLGIHFRMDDVILDSSGDLVHVSSAAGPTIFLAIRLLVNVSSPLARGFVVEDSTPPNSPITFFVEGLTWGADATGITNITDFFNITSSAAVPANIFAVVTNSNLGTNNFGPAGNAFVLQGGVYSVIETCLIGGMDIGVQILPSAVPTIMICTSSTFSNNTLDIDIQNTSSFGNINVNATLSKINIPPTANFGVLILGPDGSITLSGDLNQGRNWSQITNVSEQIQLASSIGYSQTPPVITALAGLNVSVSAGTGYVMISGPPNYLKYVMWSSVPSLALVDNSLPPYTINWIYVNNAGTVSVSSTIPNTIQNIILGTVRTYAGSIVYIQEIGQPLENLASNIDYVLRNTFGPIVKSGCIASPGSDITQRQVQVSSGSYSLSVNIYTPTGMDNVPFIAYYNSGTQTTGILHDVPLSWDNAGTITALLAGQWCKHAFYMLSSINGLTQSFYMVYAQETFPSELAAQDGDLPNPPGSFVGNMLPIAGLVVKQGDVPGIADWNDSRLRDIRPTLSFTSSGTTATADHNSLSNLTVGNAHPQYLRVDGTEFMTGNLNLNTVNIVGAGGNLLNGVDLLAHELRHLPGGADALATGVPVSIGTTNALGVAASFSRSDHVHKGVATIASNGGTAESGAISLINGTNVTIVDSPAGTFTFNVAAGAGGVSSIAGTINQISSSAATGAVTLSASTTFTAPGYIKDTTGFYTSTSASVSAAGNNQGTATGLTASYNIITTVASGSGVVLPVPLVSGFEITIINKGANVLNIYPASGGTINGLAINTPVTLEVGGSFIFQASSTIQWYTIGSFISTVGSFSAGTTGLTPNIPSTGSIVLGGTLIPVNGGTGFSSYTIGDLLYADTTTTLNKLADVASGRYLRSGGIGVAPLWSTLVLPNAIATGDLLFASSTNIVTSLPDVATGNALISGGIGVIPSYGKINLTTTVSGILPIANGGTNSSAALNNNRIIISSSGAIIESSALSDGQLLIGSSGALPVSAPLTAGTGITITPGPGSITIAANSGSLVTSFSAGTTGLTPNIPTSGNVILDGLLIAVNGGTGLSSFTIGDLLYADTPVTLNKLADVASGRYLRSGGVGNAPLWSTLILPNAATTGDLLFASASNTITSLADVATGNALLSGGVGAVPSYGKIILTTTVSGILPIANGGTNSSTSLNNNRIMVSSGGAIVESSALTNGQLLIGFTSALPVSASLTAGTGITITPGAGSITIAANSGALVTSFSAGTTGLTPNIASTGAVVLGGTLIAVNGGTGLSSFVIGDLLYANTTTTIAKLADVAVGSYLRSGGVTTAPLWSTLILPNTATTGDLLFASSANTITSLADVATGNALLSGGIGVVPSYGKIGLTTTVSGILPIANGGTGVSTTPTNGQLLIGNGTNYTVATVGTTTGISTTTGSGTLTINNTGVTSIIAGTGISVSGATGAVTVSSNASLAPSKITLSNMQFSIPNATTTVIGYFPWQNSLYSSYTTRTIILWAIPSSIAGKNLTVSILPDGGGSLGSVTINGGSAVGAIFTFTFTAPGSDTNLQVSVSRLGVAGNDPIIKGVTLSLV